MSAVFEFDDSVDAETVETVRNVLEALHLNVSERKLGAFRVSTPAPINNVVQLHPGVRTRPYWQPDDPEPAA